MTFRDKYFQLPGEMTNATAFWGFAGGSTGLDTACYASTTGTGTQTCNGDGDGRLDSTAASEYTEQYMYWQHMNNAGLLEGSYTGISGSGGNNHSELGVNVPASKLSNAGWTIDYDGSAGGLELYDLDYENVFKFGAARSTNSTVLAVMTPEEAWGVDKKIDDGLPARGKVIARFWNDACAAADDGSSANDDYNASYRLSDSSIQCALMFRNLF